ncbi:MAG: lipoyl(octanoyl) transferase LipB [Chloroflexi bacterium]|nr:lipoyl(octanoyl) transferase LipB [Chloroflexota bacterium]
MHWLGEGIDYAWAWDLQRQLLEERVAGERGDTLLLLGHAPVYTAGRRSVPEHVLAQLDAPLVETDRGGQTTYHGPGQLLGYPIVSLAGLGFGPKRYVEAVESALIVALADYGVAAHREEGLTGVWTERGKIAAIGVRVSRGVTMHGFALNVATDLHAYDPIVPCGIGDRPVTSLAALVGGLPDVKEVAYVVAEALGAALGIAWQAG